MIVTNKQLVTRQRELLDTGYQYRGYENSMSEEEYRTVNELASEESMSTSYGEHLYINHTHKVFWKMDSGD